MWLLLSLFALSLGGVNSQFPKVCTTPEAVTNKTCCPVWKDGSRCGEKSGRGKCLKVASLLNRKTLQINDDRFNWPFNHFTEVCFCNESYSGFDCGRCDFAYTGNNCEKNKTVIRKDIRDLAHLEKMKLFGYLSLLKNTVSEDYVVLMSGDRHDRDTYKFKDVFAYDVFTWMHYYATAHLLRNSTFSASENFAHRGPAFPVWHRRLLLFLENEVQRITGDEDFALPYYDWSRDDQCSICTNEFVGESTSDGLLSPLSYFGNWKTICSTYNYPQKYCFDVGSSQNGIARKPGSDPENAELPTLENVQHALEWTTYDTSPYNHTSERSFRNVLEGFMNPSDGVTPMASMHNVVHDYMTGTMGQVPISGNDPMFFLHHAYIDKIFNDWIQKYNTTPEVYPEDLETVPVGQSRREFMVPFFPPVQNWHFLKPSSHFGYSYQPYSKNHKYPHFRCKHLFCPPERN